MAGRSPTDAKALRWEGSPVFEEQQKALFVERRKGSSD